VKLEWQEAALHRHETAAWFNRNGLLDDTEAPRDTWKPGCPRNSQAPRDFELDSGPV